MMERFFHLDENNTTVQREIVSGLTVFLTMMYILFTNSAVLSGTGMPWRGVFIATALSATLCTLVVALYANLPFGMAPGMGLNNIFAYTICMSMGFHWKEALAIAFLSGIVHVAVMVSPYRKAFVNAFPEYLRVASGVGLGMFIAYAGLKNSGLLVFHITEITAGGIAAGDVISGINASPGLALASSNTQVVTIVGLTVMTVLTALEKRTGDWYAALPLGVLAATFIGVPLHVTRLDGALYTDFLSGPGGFSDVALSFFSSPGIGSLFATPSKTAGAVLMIAILALTAILDSIGTMIGIGQIHNARIFDREDMEKFSRKGSQSKLDKALKANAYGYILAPLLGSSSPTIYLESVTGVISGGRTGLTGIVTAFLFLICLPLSGFFSIIPNEAVAPALILAGVSMLTRLRYIDWRNFEESFPAFVTILLIPTTFSILDGISIGILCHVAVQISLGKRREVHPFLYVLSLMYITLKLGEHMIV